MKRLSIIILFITSFQIVISQRQTQDDEIFLTKALGKHISFPNCDTCDISGLALIKIYKIKNSLIIRSLYASDLCFDIENDLKFISRFKNAYAAKFRGGYTVIVPIHYDYYKEGGVLQQVSSESADILERKLKKLDRRLTISKPIYIDGHETVR